MEFFGSPDENVEMYSRLLKSLLAEHDDNEPFSERQLAEIRDVSEILIAAIDHHREQAPEPTRER